MSHETPYPLRVGPYSVEGRVGQGGMATVLLGRTESHKRAVALKIIRAYGVENQQQMVRFKREIQALYKLSHPSLVSILDAGFDGEWFYYAMEYMEGGTLRNLLDVTPRLSHDQAFRLMLQLTRATAYLHRNKIIHRDIKPSNVLLGNDGTAKLSDLGLLRFQEETDLTHSGQIIGTIRYMSPEMLDKYPMSYASDIYQLGLLFFEMLTGRAVIEKARPHQMVALILAQDPPRVSTYRADVDPALDALLLRCIEREPSGRPRDGSELCEEIERIHENWRSRPVESEEDDNSIHFIEEEELNFSVEMERPQATSPPVNLPSPPREERDEPDLSDDSDDGSDDYEPSDADSLLSAMPSTEFEAIRPPAEKIAVLPQDPDGSHPTDPVMPVMPRWKVEDTPRVVARERVSSDTIPVPVAPPQPPRRSTEIPTVRADEPAPVAPPAPATPPRRSTEIPAIRAEEPPAVPAPAPAVPAPAVVPAVTAPAVPSPPSEPSPRNSGSRLTGVSPATPPVDPGSPEAPPGQVVHFSPVGRNERQRPGKGTGSKEQPALPPRHLEGAVIGLLIVGVGLVAMLLMGDRNAPVLPGSLLLSQETHDGGLKLRARWTLREPRPSKLRVRFLSREESEQIWKDSKDPTSIIAQRRDPPHLVEIEKPSGTDHDVQVPAPPGVTAAFVQVDCGSPPAPTWVHVSLTTPPVREATPTPTPTPTPTVTPVTSTPTPAPTPASPTQTTKEGKRRTISRTDLPPAPPPEVDPGEHPEGLEIVWKLPALTSSQEILRPPSPILPSENYLAIRTGDTVLVRDAQSGANVCRFDLETETPGFLSLSRSDSLIAWIGDRIHVREVAGTKSWSIQSEEPRKEDEDILMERIGNRLLRCERNRPGRFRVIVNSLFTGSQSWSYTGEGQALGWVMRPGETEDFWLIHTAPGSGTTSPRVLAQKFHLETGPGDGSWVTLTVLDGEPPPGSKPRMQVSDQAIAMVLGRRFVVWRLTDWSKTHDLELNARMSDPWPEARGPVAMARSSRPGEPLVIAEVSDRAVYGIEDGGSASATTGNHHLVLVSGSLFRYDITGMKIEATGVLPWQPRGRMERFLMLSSSDEPILDSNGGLIKLRWR